VLLIEDLFSKSGVSTDCFSPPPVAAPAPTPIPTEVADSDKHRTKVGDLVITPQDSIYRQYAIGLIACHHHLHLSVCVAVLSSGGAAWRCSRCPAEDARAADEQVGSEAIAEEASDDGDALLCDSRR